MRGFFGIEREREGIAYFSNRCKILPKSSNLYIQRGRVWYEFPRIVYTLYLQCLCLYIYLTLESL